MRPNSLQSMTDQKSPRLEKRPSYQHQHQNCPCRFTLHFTQCESPVFAQPCRPPLSHWLARPSRRPATHTSPYAATTPPKHLYIHCQLLAVNSIMRFASEGSLARSIVQNASTGWTTAVCTSFLKANATRLLFFTDMPQSQITSGRDRSYFER